MFLYFFSLRVAKLKGCEQIDLMSKTCLYSKKIAIIKFKLHFINGEMLN